MTLVSLIDSTCHHKAASKPQLRENGHIRSATPECSGVLALQEAADRKQPPDYEGGRMPGRHRHAGEPT